MFIGDKKKPMYIGKKGEFLEELDAEFDTLLDDAYSHISGFKTISADDEYTDGYIVATRYLVLELMREYSSNGRL